MVCWLQPLDGGDGRLLCEHQLFAEHGSGPIKRQPQVDGPAGPAGAFDALRRHRTKRVLPPASRIRARSPCTVKWIGSMVPPVEYYQSRRGRARLAQPTACMRAAVSSSPSWLGTILRGASVRSR